jgi:hypothetical protein
MPETLMAAPERFVVARDALLEITAESTVGELISETVADDGVVTMLFAATMTGYPGWHWTVSVAELSGEEPTVLEAELLPGDGALLAPDWVPWSERLEDYKEAQVAAAAAAGVDELGDDADDADDDDDDSDDDDDLGDDPDDGIDFEDLGAEERTAPEGDLPDVDELDELDEPEELDVPPVGVEQADEAEGQADDAGPQPPDVAALDESAEEEQ